MDLYTSTYMDNDFSLYDTSGKTTYIAQLMNNTGRIDAWDIHEHRVKLVEEQAQKLEDSQSESVDDMTVANGGAALTAYSKLMFCDGQMDQALRTALLRYCELDTMAMVFIWEYFLHIIYQQQNTANLTPGRWS